MKIQGDFNLFSHQPDQPNENQDKTVSNEMNYSAHSDIQRMNLFQRQLENYSSKYSDEQMKNSFKRSNLLHFDFSAQQEEDNYCGIKFEKKKNNTISYSNNFSLIERIKESNLHYVGFDNKNGDNSCYINVILHFLYIFPCINEFLIKFYKTKSKNLGIDNSSSFKDCEFFLFLLGKILFEYQKILSDENKKGITILQTTELRSNLHLLPRNISGLNQVGDPVEFLNILLEEINKKNKLEVHKYFFINLIEEINCNIFCKNKEINKYDENNFIYQIYVNEIFDYIHGKNLDFHQYNHRLFFFSKQCAQNYIKRCKNCYNKGFPSLKLIGSDYPEYFLLNCAWNNNRPKINDVIQFLYLLSLEDTLQNIFTCENNKKYCTYNLLGMVLYSGALTHYIGVIFNFYKNVFVLYNDDKIKELSSIHEVYIEITAEQIKRNENAFYYPVLLVYYKEIIYNDKKTIELNEYSYSKFKNLENLCSKAKERHIPSTKEQKERNYFELIQAQKIFNRKNRIMSEDQRYENLDMIIEEVSNHKSANEINSQYYHEINTKNENNMNVEDEKEKIFEFERDEEPKESNEIMRNNKRYGTDYKRSKNYYIKSPNFFSNII